VHHYSFEHDDNALNPSQLECYKDFLEIHENLLIFCFSLYLPFKKSNQECEQEPMQDKRQ
jgi:hypothetical protein